MIRSKYSILFFVVFVLGIQTTVQAQWVDNARRSLFSDVKAYTVGDALTILIVEDTRADNTANTNQSATTNIGGTLQGGIGNTQGNVNGSIGTQNNFNGRGQTNRGETFRAKLTAKVLSVEPNGNLKIEATRTTKINGENQKITLSGLVRPVDLNDANSVYSYQVMDLTLIYDGDGTLSETQEPGLITKFLRFLF
jgi:flagellar L-ring protein precursor FlgH